MRHEDIWRAIDTLAAERGLSPSALARLSGLDPTSFNPSKRQTTDGRSRWPSTESIAKILAVTNAGLEDFSALVMGARVMSDSHTKRRSRLPLIDMVQAGALGFFDDGGFPVGSGWNEVELPGIMDTSAYAMSIGNDSMLPIYRNGDIIVVSPAAPVRQGDRVVTRSRDGTIMAKLLRQRTARFIELVSLNPDAPGFKLQAKEVLWMHRIIWASQ